jgi:hypothetical protein
MNARPSPLQLSALSPNGYSVLVLAVFRAEADEEVAGSFFAAVPSLPGSGARVQARYRGAGGCSWPEGFVEADAERSVMVRARSGSWGTALFAEFPGGHLAPMKLPAPFAAGLRGVFGRL